MKKNVTMLMILDGYGDSSNNNGNAIANSRKPYIDKLLLMYPTAKIDVKEELTELKIAGDSEIGNASIGAGRVINKDITRITKSIEDGDFFSIPEFVNAIDICKENNSKLHIMGLLSDGGIHSHQRHLYALLELAKRKGFDNVYVHCFMDGRDSLPASGESYLQKLEEAMKEKGVGKIATICGRYYAMDRDNHWDREQKVYEAMVSGKGEMSTSAIQAIESSYQKEIFDEFVKPTVICNGDKPVATIEDGDSIIFYNFRADRMRQLTRVFADSKFKEFKTKRIKLNIVTMTEYDNLIQNISSAFKKEKVVNTLGECISKKGMKQLRIAETEKYADISYFFNVGREEKYDGEDRVLVDSKNIQTYDLQPEMSAYEVADEAIKAIKEEKYDFILLNFANLDMVGHTGNIRATEKSIEVIDECVGKIINTLSEHNGICLITSDHGNAEQMIDYKTGEPYTSHTNNSVPAILYGMEKTKLQDGKITDIAPTILDIMNIDKPKEMTGKSLLLKN